MKNDRNPKTKLKKLVVKSTLISTKEEVKAKSKKENGGMTWVG